ncbi:MAG: hypothetical protein AAFS10_22935 [Myxococcota bacterium]
MEILLYITVAGFGAWVLVVMSVPFMMFSQWWTMRRAVAQSNPQKAFRWRITLEKLHNDKKLVAEVSPLIKSVGLMRNTYGAGNVGYGGPSVLTKFECFLIDTNGSTHRISEYSEHKKAHREALEIAQLLGVPYRDASYGG